MVFARVQLNHTKTKSSGSTPKKLDNNDNDNDDGDGEICAVLIDRHRERRRHAFRLSTTRH